MAYFAGASQVSLSLSRVLRNVQMQENMQVKKQIGRSGTGAPTIIISRTSVPGSLLDLPVTALKG